MFDCVGDPEATPSSITTLVEPSATGTAGGNTSSGGVKTGAIVGGRSPLLFSCAIGLNMGNSRCRWWGRRAHHHLGHRVLRCSLQTQEEREIFPTTIPIPEGAYQSLDNPTQFTRDRPKCFDWAHRWIECSSTAIRELFVDIFRQSEEDKLGTEY